MGRMVDWGDRERTLTAHVSVLVGDPNTKAPKITWIPGAFEADR